MFNPKQTRKIAAVIILVVIVAMVATSIIPYIRRIFLMAARKKKRELSEKAQKRIRQRNLHVGITVIAAIVIIFSVIQFTLWRYVSKVDEEHICKNVFIGKTDVSGMTKEEAVKAVNNTLGDYRNKQLVLKVKDQGADVSIEEMGAEVENIDKLAKKAVGYGKNGSIWSRYQKIHNLDKKKYVIDESFKVDEAKLRELIQERAVPLEQKAVNASASYNGSGFDLTDEAEGYTVDVDKSVKKIKNFMNKKWNYEDAEVELKLDTEEPTIKKADLESLQDELGSYTTNAGWGDRVQNIRRATELINGTVVMPGEEFSVEQATLPYTEENGYVAGSAYENGQIVESIGGGLCQVSTTLYNAVLYAELEVTRRAPHSMSVSYVEPSRDAMIAEGISDFKFVNNYDTPILIEGYIDGNNQLGFYIYGKDTRAAGHSVEFESETLETTEYTKKYVEDTESAVGSQETEGAGMDGSTARLWKVTYENGEEVSREVINNSTYQTSDVTVKVGTKSDNAEATKLVEEAIATQNQEKINAAISKASALK